MNDKIVMEIKLFVDDTEASSQLVNRIAWNNHIRVQFTNTGEAINYVECRLTPTSMPYGVGVGQLLYEDYGAIANNTPYEFSFDVIPSIFQWGNTQYNCALYARDANDGSWNEFLCFRTIPLQTELDEEFLLRDKEPYKLADDELQIGSKVDHLQFRVVDGSDHINFNTTTRDIPYSFIILDKFQISSVSGTPESLTTIEQHFGE